MKQSRAQTTKKQKTNAAPAETTEERMIKMCAIINELRETTERQSREIEELQNQEEKIKTLEEKAKRLEEEHAAMTKWKEERIKWENECKKQLENEGKKTRRLISTQNQKNNRDDKRKKELPEKVTTALDVISNEVPGSPKSRVDFEKQEAEKQPEAQEVGTQEKVNTTTEESTNDREEENLEEIDLDKIFDTTPEGKPTQETPRTTTDDLSEMTTGGPAITLPTSNAISDVQQQGLVDNSTGLRAKNTPAGTCIEQMPAGLLNWDEVITETTPQSSGTPSIFATTPERKLTQETPAMTPTPPLADKRAGANLEKARIRRKANLAKAKAD
jgi:hypothetical protein